MSEKLAEVYEQYDMEILSTKKGRGATILSTTDGLRILEPFRGSMTRLEQEYVLKQLFLKEGCFNLDYLIPNKEGMLFTCDKYRQPFVLKKHFEGNECDMHNPSDIVRAIEALARFHIYGKKVVQDFQTAWLQSRKEKEQRRIEEIRRAIADGEELERIAYVYEISQNALEEALKAEKVKEGEPSEDKINEKKETQDEPFEINQSENIGGTDMDIENIFIRHNREIKKIQRFMNKVKRKNAFENLFLQVFSDYYRQGTECVEMLDKILQGENEKTAHNIFKNHYGICHGTYNQHNVIIGKEEEAIVHFERFSKGNQLNDLYQFARKAMEKNHFDFELLEKIFQTYGQKIELSGEDYQYMYILFSYPEKFWKIANSYYNTNKAFLSPKYLEKLETVILQEKEKREMLSEYFTFHLR
ncbi:MAG: hypothetical protein K2J90_15165 [Lachnospiraceae bacterium]|nr:hypothetical protein [Lachnospiraceae bacterium]